LDRHTCGLFGHDEWLRMMADAGFEPSWLPFVHSEVEPGSAEVFLGRRPSDT
jgi:hypothetical protein